MITRIARIVADEMIQRAFDVATFRFGRKFSSPHPSQGTALRTDPKSTDHEVLYEDELAVDVGGSVEDVVCSVDTGSAPPNNSNRLARAQHRG